MSQDPNTLAARFNELAKKDPSLVAAANELSGRCEYQITSRNYIRSTKQSFCRWANEAAQAAGVVERDNLNEGLGVREWLAYLFREGEHLSSIDRQTETSIGILTCRIITNAAEASALVLEWMADGETESDNGADAPRQDEHAVNVLQVLNNATHLMTREQIYEALAKRGLANDAKTIRPHINTLLEQGYINKVKGKLTIAEPGEKYLSVA